MLLDTFYICAFGIILSYQILSVWFFVIHSFYTSYPTVRARMYHILYPVRLKGIGLSSRYLLFESCYMAENGKQARNAIVGPGQLEM